MFSSFLCHLLPLFETFYYCFPSHSFPYFDIYSGVCYKERCYNERMLQRTVCVNKIRMLQRTQMLQQRRRNTIGRRSICMRMAFRDFPV
jgi:hypothetical protein